MKYYHRTCYTQVTLTESPKNSKLIAKCELCRYSFYVIKDDPSFSIITEEEKDYLTFHKKFETVIE